MYKLGIDVGGTNTDAVLISNDLDVIARCDSLSAGRFWCRTGEDSTGYARDNTMHQCHC